VATGQLARRLPARSVRRTLSIAAGIVGILIALAALIAARKAHGGQPREAAVRSGARAEMGKARVHYGLAQALEAQHKEGRAMASHGGGRTQ
jgi:hypothetical protein